MARILTKREKYILYATIAIFTAAFAFNFMFVPLMDNYDKLNNEINTAKARLKRYMKLIRQEQHYKNLFSEQAGQLNQTKGGDVLAGRLQDIESIAKSSGIKIVDIRPQGQGRKLEVDLRAEATMEHYLKFLYDMENSLMLLRIRRCQLTMKPESNVIEGDFSINLQEK